MADVAAGEAADALGDDGDRIQGPRRGSAAAGQKRDAGGRFAPRRARKVPGQPRGRPGRSGRSHHARLSHLALVRVLVRLEHMVGRLQAEASRVAWSDPVPRVRANVHGLRAKESGRVARTVQALHDVLEELATARDDAAARDSERLAAMLSTRLGRKVWGRTLYRPPYDAIWRDAADLPALLPTDGAAGFAARSRLPRRHLIHRIERLQLERDALLPVLRARLVEESDADPEAWAPLPPPRPRGSALTSLRKA